MSLPATVAELVSEFRANGRIVIVGASLAGPRAAEALREEGFTGSLTIIGDEPYETYALPPQSKQVLKGWVPADHTRLPRMRELDADRPARGVCHRAGPGRRAVRLDDGEQVGYDRLPIATGSRARRWPNPPPRPAPRHRTTTPGRHCRAAPHRGRPCRRPPPRRAPEAVGGRAVPPGADGSGGCIPARPSRPSLTRLTRRSRQ
ncbi:FAD-dependent oxidoreductase [Streptomyces erythrochromogenes]|uniref:FAD-dependent oxidoreductase n=1 Tax=Streptomyces erythrochromogenes TaxID=285574 RepID=UPI0038222493